MKELVTIGTLTALEGWDQLEASEQKKVQSETQLLARSFLASGVARIEVGEHLSNIQAVLEPKRLFNKFLKSGVRVKRSTAYSYIAAFKNAQKRLPEPVLKVVMARGINMLGDTEERPLGIYTEAVKALPPPKTEDPKQIDDWIEKVEDKRKKIRPVSGHLSLVESPETLQKEVFRFFESRYRKLADISSMNSYKKGRWVNDLFGMMLGITGVSGPKTVGPIAPSDGFKAVRGRPRLEAAA